MVRYNHDVSHTYATLGYKFGYHRFVTLSKNNSRLQVKNVANKQQHKLREEAETPSADQPRRPVAMASGTSAADHFRITEET